MLATKAAGLRAEWHTVRPTGPREFEADVRVRVAVPAGALGEQWVVWAVPAVHHAWQLHAKAEPPARAVGAATFDDLVLRVPWDETPDRDPTFLPALLDRYPTASFVALGFTTSGSHRVRWRWTGREPFVCGGVGGRMADERTVEVLGARELRWASGTAGQPSKQTVRSARPPHHRRVLAEVKLQHDITASVVLPDDGEPQLPAGCTIA